MNPQEKQKPGPKPIYGERKACMTRLETQLAERLARRIQLANIKREREGKAKLSNSEAIAQLLEFALNTIDAREKKDGIVHAPQPTPKPLNVSIIVQEINEEEPKGGQLQEVAPLTKPAPSNKSSPWGELSRRLKEMAGAETWEIWLSSLEFVSLENCKLSLMVPTPFFIEEVQGRFAEGIEAIASELCGEPISLVLSVSPEFERSQRAEEERQRQKKEVEAKAAQARVQNVARLLDLYEQGDVKAARESSVLIARDAALLDSLNSMQRKLIEQWVFAVSAGANYQTGKESEYKGPRGRGR